jgi:hypothetical protein
MKTSRIIFVITIAIILILVLWWCKRPVKDKDIDVIKEVGTATVEVHRVDGANFPPLDLPHDIEPNDDKPYLPPKGPKRGNMTPEVPLVKLVPILFDNNGDPINQGGADVNFYNFNNAGSIGVSNTPEPSVAANNQVVFMTYNWGARYSLDDGATWTTLDPTTIFPSGAQTDGAGNSISGPFCCDQVLQYVPSIDRFIWFMQFCGDGAGGCTLAGNNIIRIASASTANFINSGGTSWTYWDIRNSQVEATSGILDYPDMSVGDNSLYISSDAVGIGLVVMRLPLKEIQAGSGFTFWYTHPTDGSTAYGGHISQNTGNEVYWAGHNNTSSMRIFSWKESETTYSWRDRNINSWTNGLANNTPSGVNWLSGSNGFPGNAVLGITRRGDEVWFAWAANAGGGFKNAHVEVVKFRNTNYSVIEQMQIWNNDYAFAYPCFATNTDNEVGVSLEWGGVTAEANHAAGFMGDFVVYYPRLSAASNARNGDYVTIRKFYENGNLFAAAGYTTQVNPPPVGGNFSDVHYILFGR